MGACAVVGYAAMQLVVRLLPRIEGGKAARLCTLALTLVSAVVVWLIAVGVHEAGHLLGGWLRGGRFLLYQVGPFRLKRSPSGIRWSLNRGVNVFGGLAACQLPENGNLVSRFRTLLIGGPLASLVLALAALAWTAAMAQSDERVPWPEASGRIFLALLGFTSSLIFVVTVFPFENGGFRSDGRRYLNLLSSGPAARQEAAMLVLSFASYAGTRPRDFKPETVAEALSLRDDSLWDRYAQWLAYSHAADRQAWVDAQAYLDKLVAAEASLPGFLVDMVRAEYAWLLAARRQDPAMARAWLESAGKVEFDPSARLKAEAAVLLNEGKKAEAAARAQQALRSLEETAMATSRNPWAAESVQAILDEANRSD